MLQEEDSLVEAWRYEKCNMLRKAHIGLLPRGWVECLKVAGNRPKKKKKMLYDHRSHFKSSE